MPPSPPSVLVVDDEAAVRRMLCRAFEAEGWQVHEADGAAATYEMLAAQSIDIVTLDVALGAESGLDVARELSAHHEVGLIMVSGRGELLDTVLGLEIGADDYVSKPFELREIVARVRALHRRLVARAAPKLGEPARSPDGGTRATAGTAGSAVTAAATDGPRFCTGGCTLWPERRLFVSDADADVPIELTTGEFDLLEVLLRNAHQVLSRDRLMDLLKGHDWHPNDRSIDNQVARLRRKLVPLGLGSEIRTVRGAGYLFAADVVRHGRRTASPEVSDA